MVAADRDPQQRRIRGQATAADGLALGLHRRSRPRPRRPRNGATLERRPLARLHPAATPTCSHADGRAARDRRGGAAQGRAARGAAGCPRSRARRSPPGTAASFGSTLASQALIRFVERDSACGRTRHYRAGLAGWCWDGCGAPPAGGGVEAHGFAHRTSFVSGNGSPATATARPGHRRPRPARPRVPPAREEVR